MKLLIHDLEEREFKSLFPNMPQDVKIISDNGKIAHCIGCFGCWIKTPGQCVMKDGYENMGLLMSKADEVIVISRCVYGTYSPFVKNILDRSISYILPYFRKIGHKTHHKPRYKQQFHLSAYFYGEEISDEEKLTAQKMVKANGTNFNAKGTSVAFVHSKEELKTKMSLEGRFA